MADQSPLGKVVETADGSLTMRHPEHGECYHSDSGAEFEATKLYVEESGILDAFESSERINVLDVGLGLGYNAMSTIDAWSNSGGQSDLEILSLEVDPNLVDAFCSGRAPWQRDWNSERKNRLQNFKDRKLEWDRPSDRSRLSWQIHVSDARSESLKIPEAGYWDFVWQDPFSPQKNPRMWDVEWFRELRRVASPKAVLMTYSVARLVRDNLKEAGWFVERIPAAGVKRNWLRAIA